MGAALAPTTGQRPEESFFELGQRLAQLLATPARRPAVGSFRMPCGNE